MKKQISKKTEVKSKKKKQKRKYIRVNTKHKDTLFRRIFTSRKEWTLALYNAVNGTDYTDPDLIEYTTIEDAVYMGMKNDISLLVTDTMNFYEHQSTYNPNMPMRMFIYAGMVYSKYADSSKNNYNLYSSAVSIAPVPKLVCFYNGEKDKPDETVLNLCDAFDKNVKAESDISVRVRMVNINYGHNKEIMNACRPLNEYAWFVNEVRSNSRKYTLDDSVDKAIDEMPEDYIIKPWLTDNRSEVRRLCITEFNAKKFESDCKREAEEERKRADRAEDRADKAEDRADRAEDRADKAEDRADKAEDRADRAEDRADRAEDRAVKAEDRAADAEREIINSIKSVMEKTKMTADEAMDMMGISEGRREVYIKSLEV